MHQAFFNAAGWAFSSARGHCRIPILKTYYSYALSSATRLSLDYHFINNPAYNTQRGLVNAFAVRLHTQF